MLCTLIREMQRKKNSMRKYHSRKNNGMLCMLVLDILRQKKICVHVNNTKGKTTEGYR